MNWLRCWNLNRICFNSVLNKNTKLGEREQQHVIVWWNSALLLWHFGSVRRRLCHSSHVQHETSLWSHLPVFRWMTQRQLKGTRRADVRRQLKKPPTDVTSQQRRCRLSHSGKQSKQWLSIGRNQAKERKHFQTRPSFSAVLLLFVRMFAYAHKRLLPLTHISSKQPITCTFTHTHSQ